jgi:hypothetical protein
VSACLSAQVRHFKSKWQEEFEKRKKLHNAVRHGGGRQRAGRSV